MSAILKAAAIGGVAGGLVMVPVEVALLALQAPAVPGGVFGAAGTGAVVGALIAVGLYKGKVDRLEREVDRKADKATTEKALERIDGKLDRIFEHLMEER